MRSFPRNIAWARPIPDEAKKFPEAAKFSLG